MLSALRSARRGSRRLGWLALVRKLWRAPLHTEVRRQLRLHHPRGTRGPGLRLLLLVLLLELLLMLLLLELLLLMLLLELLHLLHLLLVLLLLLRSWLRRLLRLLRLLRGLLLPRRLALRHLRLGRRSLVLQLVDEILWAWRTMRRKGCVLSSVWRVLLRVLWRLLPRWRLWHLEARWQPLLGRWTGRNRGRAHVERDGEGVGILAYIQRLRGRRDSLSARSRCPHRVQRLQITQVVRLVGRSTECELPAVRASAYPWNARRHNTTHLLPALETQKHRRIRSHARAIARCVRRHGTITWQTDIRMVRSRVRVRGMWRGTDRRLRLMLLLQGERIVEGCLHSTRMRR